MLEKFPDIPTQRIAIKIKPAAEKMVKQGHPWIFDAAIKKQSITGNAGDLAIIFDQRRNKLLALGLYDPQSPIRVRILHFGPAKINEAWFIQKIQTAYDIRRPLLATATDSYRLIHGENDHFSGLIVDVYANVLVVKIYSPVWLPYIKTIFPILLKVSACETLVLRLSRSLQKNKTILHGLFDGQVVFGKLDEEEVIFKEYGIKFSANVIHGHKTGFFLDHRNNRKRIGELAKNKSVLDIFSYAGGFSVHALKGGAKEVISLDISAKALEMATKNIALNGSTTKHKTMAIDAFEGMQQLIEKRKIYDIVIVDPPSFAKRDSERNQALKTYTRLCKLAIQLVKPKGILLMASCSSRIQADEYFTLVETELIRSKRKFAFLEKTFHDIDHPINFKEGAYLKSVYYKMGN